MATTEGILKLQEDRMKLWNQMQDLDKRALSEKRKLSTDEGEQWDRMEKDIAALDKDIDREEKRMKLASIDSQKEERVLEAKVSKLGHSERRQLIERHKRGESLSPDERAVMNEMDKYSQVFSKMLARGFESLNHEERSMVENRALSSDATTGSYLVAEQYSYEIERVQVLMGGMLEACRVVRSDKGGNLPWPKNDDTSNTAEWLGQNNEATEGTDATIGLETLADYTLSSGPIKVSEQLIHDSAFNIQNFVTTIAGERLGRKANAGFTTGAGSTLPTGLFKASYATVGKTTASNSTITFDELIDMQHSINPIYRKKMAAPNFTAPGANPMDSTFYGWMFNDTTLSVIRKLKDDDGKYIWQASTQPGAPSTLLGDPYIINPDVADIASGALIAAYGDFSGYLIRKINHSTVKTLKERYAEYYQIAWLMFERYDGKLINASKVKTLKMAT